MSQWKGIVDKAMGNPEKKPTTLSSLSVTIDKAREKGIMPAANDIRASIGGAAGVPGADSCIPNLTLQQRIQGCLACFFIGLGLSGLGMFMWWREFLLTPTCFLSSIAFMSCLFTRSE